MTTYSYILHLPSLGSPRFDMSRFRLVMILSALAAVNLACSLIVSFPSNHNPEYFRAVQSLISSPFRRWGGGAKRKNFDHLCLLLPIAKIENSLDFKKRKK